MSQSQQGKRELPLWRSTWQLHTWRASTSWPLGVWLPLAKRVVNRKTWQLLVSSMALGRNRRTKSQDGRTSADAGNVERRQIGKCSGQRAGKDRCIWERRLTIKPAGKQLFGQGKDSAHQHILDATGNHLRRRSTHCTKVNWQAQWPPMARS